MENVFREVKKNFGFGCMRFPMNGEEVDTAEVCKMVDYFIAEGFNYFDTAHGYIDGKSELAIKECLTSRYPRDAYILVNKLTGSYFKSREDIRPFFESQLEACGVDYFDFYLMHSQGRGNYPKYKACAAYEEAFALKKEGKIKHVGLSYHDGPELLRQILTDYPEVEVVQIQFNYADYENPSVRSKEVYEVCREFGKPVIVMEPVKGGHLVNLPTEAVELIRSKGMSPAELAIRYAASPEGVFMTLSGMGNMDMMRENTAFMKDFSALSTDEYALVDSVKKIMAEHSTVPCTACGYCLAGCPMGIKIPDLFSCLNNKRMFKGDWNSKFYYGVLTEKGGAASSCIECGACEDICPQHLEIRELLKTVAEEFEKK